jgi:predicted ATPase/class 3 adenylate cyclase/DNA-binding response OmpR family regulator
MRPRVLVIAPQAGLRAAIARGLAVLGCPVELASSEKTARQLLTKEKFGAAVIAPPSSSSSDLAFLREAAGAVDKFVVLTDEVSAAKRFAALFPEALVCPSQPLDTEQLVSFLSNLEGQRDSSDASGPLERVQFQGCTVDIPGHLFLDANHREVPLTRREFALLVTFARNAGRVLSRAQLRNAIDGGSTETFDRSIDMLVVRLRRKIEPHPAKSHLILTVPGVGYKFLPQVRPLEMAADAPRGQDSTRGGHAERRQLTVLSCQILGFAALAAEVDPEDLGGLIGRPHAACAEVIARFGGTMVLGIGDTVLAYFGYPKAQENNAESAVRAALGLVRAVDSLDVSPGRKFGTRIGVATGIIVISEMNAVGSKTPTAIGEALNLALHVQQAAPAGSVLITAKTRSLLGRLFRYRELDVAVVIEDGLNPLPVWQVLDEASALPRFDALRRDSMPNLVGRKAELDRLLQLWRDGRRGSGQVVLMTGEPGIGKSRLVVELEEQLQAEPHTTIRFFGWPHRCEAAMAALLDALQCDAGFSPHDTPRQKVEKLGKAFAVLGPLAGQATALITGLLGLPLEVPSNISELSPPKRKELTFALLLDLIASTAAKRPALIIVEDAQWIDPTSLEFLALVVERAHKLSLLLMIVGRPEFVPPWPDYSYVNALTLSRLSRSDAAALIGQVAEGRQIPTLLETEILSRADGVPLFVEELTKSMLENSANGGYGGALGSSTAGTAPIPSTLHGLLLARLDRLDRSKAVAQAGAVVGREFSFELLRLIVDLDEPALLGALVQLVSSGLVFRRGAPPQATYVFKHALVRDAAYGMLLRERRQRLHRNVARAYEENLPEVAQTQPELLAYHWREAGDPIKAVGYLLIAAERALLRSTSTESLAHLTLARELIMSLAESTERLRLQLQLEITLARTLLATSGYTAPETRAAYRRARQCCEALGDQHFQPLTMHGQWVCAWVGADYEYALREAHQLYSWGKRNNDLVGLAVAHSDLGLTLTTLGRFTEARDHLAQALRINKFVLPGRQPFIASDADGRISTLSFMQYCLLLLGFPDQANKMATEAASLKPHNLYSRALAQARLLRMHVFVRDTEATARGALELLQLAQQQGYPFFIATANVYMGWACAQNGEVAKGIQACQQGLAQLQAIRGRSWLPFYFALLAECHAQNGDYARAEQAVADALQAIETTDERIWEAEVLRLKGNLLLRGRSDAAAAEQCFAAALEVARRQKAKLLELRAAMSLASLERPDRHHVQPAIEMLASVYQSFTEGFDFIDIREANLLLVRFAFTPAVTKSAAVPARRN